MKLVIAEKPSVGMSIGKVLGAYKKQDGYLEGGGWLVSWCVGHLCDFAGPESYNEAYAKWRYDDLPLLPEPWKLHLLSGKHKQFETLKKLFARSDVSAVVNACDAGREGERIFRTVYEMAGCRKPIQRLWISSMEDAAIRKGFSELRPGEEYNNLYAAADCRAKADWLVGINATRLMSVLYHRKLTVGRVQSPTLTMLVERQAEISSFKSKPFFTVELDCGKVSASSERFDTAEEANALLNACKGRPVSVYSITREYKEEKPPKLYDLTTLQREANKRLGYSAQQTLDYLQELYEKKFCTYPRSDARFLTDDMESAVPDYLASSAKLLHLPAPGAVNAAQICNSKKVTDHHAIIPTVSAGDKEQSELSAGQREILAMLARRLFCAVSEPYGYDEVVVTLNCAGQKFLAKRKVPRDYGWRQYAEKPKDAEPLPELRAGDTFFDAEAAIKEGKTQPPKPYTEDTLLSAMETAGAKEMPDDAERKGLGTPATRAAIIEKLVACGYVERKKDKKTTWLLPANSGVSLAAVLPEKLRSPLLTAEWETKLKQVEHGELSPVAFLSGIAEMVEQTVRHYQVIQGAELIFPSDRTVVGTCPRCGSAVTESAKGWFCERRDCKFALWRDNRFLSAAKISLTTEQAKELLTAGKTFVKNIYSAKKDKTFDAFLCLSDNGEHINYRYEFPDRPRKEG